MKKFLLLLSLATCAPAVFSFSADTSGSGADGFANAFSGLIEGAKNAAGSGGAGGADAFADAFAGLAEGMKDAHAGSGADVKGFMDAMTGAMNAEGSGGGGSTTGMPGMTMAAETTGAAGAGPNTLGFMSGAGGAGMAEEMMNPDKLKEMFDVPGLADAMTGSLGGDFKALQKALDAGPGNEERIQEYMCGPGFKEAYTRAVTKRMEDMLKAFEGLGSGGCCKAMTAKCMACSAGMTEDEFCWKNQDFPGCGGGPCAIVDCAPGWTKVGADEKGCGGTCKEDGVACCDAMTVECMACNAGMTEEEFCRKHQDVEGCGGCPPCAAPPGPGCTGTGPCGCGPYKCDGPPCDLEYCGGACAKYKYCMTAPDEDCTNAPTDCAHRCAGCRGEEGEGGDDGAPACVKSCWTEGMTKDDCPTNCDTSACGEESAWWDAYFAGGCKKDDGDGPPPCIASCWTEGMTKDDCPKNCDTSACGEDGTFWNAYFAGGCKKHGGGGPCAMPAPACAPGWTVVGADENGCGGTCKVDNKVCCEAMTASCMACKAGMPEDEFCRTHQDVEGCSGDGGGHIVLPPGCDLEYCGGACAPYKYCMTAPDENCANAPTDCAHRCGGCGGEGGGGDGPPDCIASCWTESMTKDDCPTNCDTSACGDKSAWWDAYFAGGCKEHGGGGESEVGYGMSFMLAAMCTCPAADQDLMLAGKQLSKQCMSDAEQLMEKVLASMCPELGSINFDDGKVSEDAEKCLKTAGAEDEVTNLITQVANVGNCPEVTVEALMNRMNSAGGPGAGGEVVFQMPDINIADVATSIGTAFDMMCQIGFGPPDCTSVKAKKCVDECTPCIPCIGAASAACAPCSRCTECLKFVPCVVENKMKDLTGTLTDATNMDKFAEAGLGAAMGTVMDAADRAGDITTHLVDLDAKEKFNEANDALAGIASWIGSEVGKDGFDFALIPEDKREAMTDAATNLEKELRDTAQEIRDAIEKGDTETKQRLLKQRDALLEAMDGAKAMDKALDRAEDVARERINDAAERWKDAGARLDALPDTLKGKLQAARDFVSGDVVNVFDGLVGSDARGAFMRAFEVFEGAGKFLTGEFDVDADQRLAAFSKGFLADMKTAEAAIKGIYDGMAAGAEKTVIGAAMGALTSLENAQEDAVDEAKERVNTAFYLAAGLAADTDKAAAFAGIDKVKDYMTAKKNNFDTIKDELQDEGARRAGLLVDKALDDATDWISKLHSVDDLGDAADITATMDKMGRAFAMVESQVKLLEIGDDKLSDAQKKQRDQLKTARDTLKDMKDSISNKVFDHGDKWKEMNTARVDKAKGVWDTFKADDAKKAFAGSTLSAKLGDMADASIAFLDHAKTKADDLVEKAEKEAFVEASAALEDAATFLAGKGLDAVASMGGGTVERIRQAHEELGKKLQTAQGKAKEALKEAQDALTRVQDARDEAWKPPADLADACADGAHGVKCLRKCRLALSHCFREGAEKPENCKEAEWAVCADVAKETVPEPPRDLQDQCTSGDAGCAARCGEEGARCLLSEKNGFELPGCKAWLEHCGKLRPGAGQSLPAPPAYLDKVCRTANLACRTACAPAEVCLVDPDTKGCAAYSPCTVLAEEIDEVFDFLNVDDGDVGDVVDAVIDADVPELEDAAEDDVRAVCEKPGAECAAKCAVAALRCKFRPGTQEMDPKCAKYRACLTMPVIKNEVDRAAEKDGFARAKCPKNKDTGETCSGAGHCPFDREHKGSKCKCDAGRRGGACERQKDDAADAKLRAAKAAAVKAAKDRADLLAQFQTTCHGKNSAGAFAARAARMMCPKGSAKPDGTCVAALAECFVADADLAKDAAERLKAIVDEVKKKKDTCADTEVYCGMRCVDRKVGCLKELPKLARCADGERRCRDGSCAAGACDAAADDAAQLCPDPEAADVPCGDGLTCARSRKECDLTVPRDGPPPGAVACAAHGRFWVSDSDAADAKAKCAKITGCPDGEVVCGFRRDKDGKPEQEDLPDELVAVLEADAADVNFGEVAATGLKRSTKRAADVRSALLTRGDGTVARRSRPLCVPKAQCKPGRGLPAKPRRETKEVDPAKDVSVDVVAAEDPTVKLAAIKIPKGAMRNQGDAADRQATFNLLVEPVSDGVLESSPAIKDFRNRNLLASEVLSITADSADFEVVGEGVQVDLVVRDQSAHADAAACRKMLDSLCIYSVQDVTGDPEKTRDEQEGFKAVDAKSAALTAETNLRKEARCGDGSWTDKGVYTCACRYHAFHFSDVFLAVDKEGEYPTAAPSLAPTAAPTTAAPTSVPTPLESESLKVTTSFTINAAAKPNEGDVGAAIASVLGIHKKYVDVTVTAAARRRHVRRLSGTKWTVTAVIDMGKGMGVTDKVDAETKVKAAMEDTVALQDALVAEGVAGATVVGAVTAAAEAAPPTPAPEDVEGLSVGAIVGIACGSVAVIAVVVYFTCHSTHKNHGEHAGAVRRRSTAAADAKMHANPMHEESGARLSQAQPHMMNRKQDSQLSLA